MKHKFRSARPWVWVRLAVAAGILLGSALLIAGPGAVKIPTRPPLL
jgi:hypothetical protein